MHMSNTNSSDTEGPNVVAVPVRGMEIKDITAHKQGFETGCWY